jgi:trehalose 6-phosphate synthase
MRNSLRFVLPLVTSVALVAVLFAVYQVSAERRSLRNDLFRRADLLAASLQDTIQPDLENRSDRELKRVVDKFALKDHLDGLAVYDAGGTPLAITTGFEAAFRNPPDVAGRARDADRDFGEFVQLDGSSKYVYAAPLHNASRTVGALALFYDAGYINTQISHLWRAALVNAAIQTFLIGCLAFLLLRWNFLRPLTHMTRWMQSLRAGNASAPPKMGDGAFFQQLTHEATHLAQNLDAARASAETEARLRESGESVWTADRLRVSIRGKLHGSPLFIVSNREPYSHVRKEKIVDAIVPASGLVTAIEPVLLASDGTWIAHGSGNADREFVDEHDRLRVPADNPRYTLRRVWLSHEEEDGYYYGFANEGLWPLCHTAHTRPIFEPDDWAAYQEVNRRFAEATLEEMEGTEQPIVLVQDYHFALLPRLLKEARPDARVAIFWHIPWPNPEVFGICPWQRELLEGLLGADIIGFHTQSHCNNFLETVDRALEALIEWDRFAVNRQGHLTRVRPYPISVAFPEPSPLDAPLRSVGEERHDLLSSLGVEGSLLGVGVDRVDYTKGIIERFGGIEQFLETYPNYQRRFTFIQIGAPSRTSIPHYQKFMDEVSSEADRINQRFQAGRWRPIVFLKRHHSHEQIERYFRAADLCMVTSLHDGMNLVAKEFVAAREDESGVLVLSTFTGASRELVDALLVNPYDRQQVAEAIRSALEMSPEESARRMQRMRRIVREKNVYRWAGNLLSDLCELQVEAREHRAAVA